MNRPTLDIHSYEIWIIDHVDGILSEEEVAQLSAFLLMHPDLDVEPGEDLPTLRAPAPSGTIDKSDLKRIALESLAFDCMEEGLDPECIAQTHQVEATALQHEYSLFEASRLAADMSSIYPHKASLKKESGRIIPLWIPQVAAAASVLLAIIFLWPQPERSYTSRTGETEIAEQNLTAIAESLNEALPEFHLESPSSLGSENETTPSPSLAMSSARSPDPSRAQDGRALPEREEVRLVKLEPQAVTALPVKATREETLVVQELREIEPVARPISADDAEKPIRSNGNTLTFDSPLAYAKHLAQKQDILALKMEEGNGGNYRQTKVSFRSFEFSLKRRQ